MKYFIIVWLGFFVTVLIKIVFIAGIVSYVMFGNLEWVSDWLGRIAILSAFFATVVAGLATVFRGAR